MRHAAKRATNVSVKTDLLVMARKAGINLSATLERAVSEELRTLARRRWREKSKEAIDEYNLFVRDHGVFSDSTRKF